MSLSARSCPPTDGCRALAESGVYRDAPALADGGYQGTGALISHRRRRGQEQLTAEQEADNAVHRRARARVEHVFSRMKSWKTLPDCHLRGAGMHQPSTSGVTPVG